MPSRLRSEVETFQRYCSRYKKKKRGDNVFDSAPFSHVKYRDSIKDPELAERATNIFELHLISLGVRNDRAFGGQ